MQKIIGSLFGAYIVLLLIREVFWFVKDNFAVIATIIGVVVLIVGYFSKQSAKAVEERRKDDLLFINRIEKTTRSDYFRGYNIVEELGWVNVSGYNTSSEVEDALKIAAAKKGANAAIKLHWRMRKESYVAGKGKRGNPYYKNRTLYDGECVAVKIEQKIKIKKNVVPSFSNQSHENDKTKLVNAGYSSGWVGIDGNNVFGEIFNQTNDAELSFQIMRKYLLKLKNSPYKVHIFWDGKFVKFAHALKLEPKNKKLQDILTSNLSINKSELTISKIDQRVDDLIVPWAHIKTCAVISNDSYSKDYDDELIIQKSRELKELGLVLNFQVIAREIIVPELTSI